ncbi:MAG: hypothetical protein ABIC04_05720 [Nanoarchaeota archaeon]
MVDILDGLNKRHLNEFTKDFIEIIRVAFGMGKLYNKSLDKLDKYEKKYKEVVGLFNKKYKGITLQIQKTIEELRLIIYLDEKNLKEFFSNVALKVSGLKSIGISSFDEATTDDSDKFSATIANINSEVYLSYYYPEKSVDAFYLAIVEDKILLNFDYDIISDPESPEFKLCAFYGAKEDIDSAIDVFSIASSFGFIDVLSEAEKVKFRNKFDTRYLE